MKRQRNITILFIFIAAFILFLPMSVKANTIVTNYGDYQYYDNDDGTITISKYKGSDSVINIPKMIDGKIVSKIGDWAFEYNDYIKNVSLPSRLITIGRYAFFNCQNLENITIPETVTKIDDYAFYGCSNLGHISLSDNITEIGVNVFRYSSAIICCNKNSTAYMYAVANDVEYELSRSSVSSVVVSGIGDRYYTGKAIVFNNISVELNGDILREGIDYVISYENNINPGTAKVYIKGIGLYTGILGKSFSIIKQVVDISRESKLSVTGINNRVTYTGDAVKFKNIKVSLAGKYLTNNKDYTVSYKNNINSGTMKVVITGKGVYKGSVTKIIKIVPLNIAQKKLKVSVSGIPSSVVYTGRLFTYSKLTMKLGGKKLVYGKDFTVKYYNNKNAGLAKIVISGKGNYAGSITKTFNIKIPIGKTYAVGNIIYKITNSATNGRGTVAVVGSAYSRGTRKFTKLVIPDNVIIGGVRFSVVTIGDNAIKGYSYLKNVSIGSNVKSIGKNAFYGCHAIENVTIGRTVRLIGENAFAGCRSMKKLLVKTPYLTRNSVRRWAFKSTYRKVIISVPAGKLKEYKKLFKSRGIADSARITK